MIVVMGTCPLGILTETAPQVVAFFRENAYNTSMPAAAHPTLTPGRVYRTQEFARWGRNPARLAKRLVRAGELVELRRGLYVRPERSVWGAVPPDSRALVRAFLKGKPFLFTGSAQWNALGLGSTAVFAEQLVYNTKRSGHFTLDDRRFEFRRVRFPQRPTAEWFAVDLIENRERAGVSADQLVRALARAAAAGRFANGVVLDVQRLRTVAAEYGTHATVDLVERSLALAAAGSNGESHATAAARP